MRIGSGLPFPLQFIHPPEYQPKRASPPLLFSSHLVVSSAIPVAHQHPSAVVSNGEALSFSNSHEHTVVVTLNLCDLREKRDAGTKRCACKLNTLSVGRKRKSEIRRMKKKKKIKMKMRERERDKSCRARSPRKYNWSRR